MKYLVVCINPDAGSSIEFETDDLDYAITYCNECNRANLSRYTIYTEAEV